MLASLLLVKELIYSNGLEVFNIQTVRNVFQSMIIFYLSLSMGMFFDELMRYSAILKNNQEQALIFTIISLVFNIFLYDSLLDD